jgi:uncharacterized protein YoaH (UPF0181 family)
MKVQLTRIELSAVLWAVGQHSESNANDIVEMMSEGLSRAEAKALIRANVKLRNAGRYKQNIKPGDHQ